MDTNEFKSQYALVALGNDRDELNLNLVMGGKNAIAPTSLQTSLPEVEFVGSNGLLPVTLKENANLAYNPTQTVIPGQDPLTGEVIDNSPIGKGIVFIDTTVKDYQILRDGIAPGNEVVLLNPNQDGVDKITGILANRSNIPNIQIISHGSEGSVQLGSANLSLETLDRYSDDLQNWSNSLSEKADIFIWGCNVASGNEGEAFVNQLSQLTGADIAASTNLTGNPAFQADWLLEKKTGIIESPLALQPNAMQNYHSVLADISGSQVQAIKEGLQGIANWASNLDTLEPLSKKLPIIDRSISDLLDINSIFQNYLVKPVNDYFANDATPTTGELVNVLKGINITAGDLLIKVDPTSVLGDIVSTPQGNQLKFNLKFQANRTTSTSLDLGSKAAEDYGLKLTADTNVGLNGKLDIDFAFGVNLTPGLANSEAFFVQFNNLSANAEVQASNLNLGMNVGFLGANVSNGSLNLNAKVQVGLNDPNSDGNITLSEIQGTTFSNLVSVTPTGSINATLPVTTDLAGLNAVNSTVTIADSNIFNDPAPSVNVANFDNLLKFKNITPTDVIGLLNQIGDTLQTASPGWNLPNGIPFLEENINKLVDFSDVFSQFTRELFDNVLAGTNNAPANGVLNSPTVFELKLNGGSKVMVNVDPDANNQKIDDLVADINTALGTAGLGSSVIAGRDGARITFTTANSSDSLVINAAVPELGFDPNQQSKPVFKFDTIQELVDNLIPLTGLDKAGIDAKYDAATNAITFKIAGSESFSKEVELDFQKDLKIGDANLNLSGHGEGEFNGQASFNLGVGIDLSPIGSGFSLTPDTLLSSLNGGIGIKNSTGADIRITRRDGSKFEIDFDTATNVGDAIALINSTPNINVIASINDAGNGLQLTDKTTGNTKFSISAINGSVAGFGLGILGSDIDNDGGIKGNPLHGDNLTKHLFIADNSSISAEGNITANDIDLAAALGMLEVGIEDGNANFHVGASINLQDPNPADGGIRLNELLGSNGSSFPALGTPNFEANGNIKLPVSIAGLDTFGITAPTNPEINLTFTSNPIEFQATATGFDDLVPSFKDFSTADLLKLVGKTIDFIKDDKLGILNQKVPLLNKSLNDLLAFLEPIENAYNSIQAEVKNLKSTLLGSIGTLKAEASKTEFLSLLDAQTQDKLFHAIASIENAVALLPTSIDALTAELPAQLISAVGEVKHVIEDLPGSIDKTNLNNAFNGVKDKLPSAQTIAKFLFEAFGFELPDFGNVAQFPTILNNLNSAIASLDPNTHNLTEINAAKAKLSSAIDTKDPFGLAKAYDGLEVAIANLSASLTQAEKDSLNNILTNFSAAFPGRLFLSFDANHNLNLGFEWDIASFQKNVPLDFSLQTGNTVIPLTFTTNSNIDINLGAGLDLGFGFDFSNNTPYLLPSTKLELIAGFEAKNFQADVGIGGISAASLGDGSSSSGLFLKNGTDPASFTISLNDPNSDGKILFSELGSSVSAQAAGEMNLNLPVKILGNDAGTISASLTDLTDFDSFSINLPTDFLSKLTSGDLDLKLLIAGIDKFLEILQKGLESDVISKLPIIGDELDLGDGGFIKDLREQLIAPLQTVLNDPSVAEAAIQDVLYQKLGVGDDKKGLNILKLDDVNGDGKKDARDIAVTIDPATGATIDLHLGGTSTYSTDFDLGLNGLVFDVKSQGDVNLKLDYDLQLGFGVNKTEGFFFKLPDDNSHPFDFNVSVDIGNSTLDADLFFLNLKASNKDLDEAVDGKDYNGDGKLDKQFTTGLNGELSVDIIDPNGDTKLTISEIGSAKFDPSFSADATISLNLDAGIGSNKNLPRIDTDLFVYWSFDLENGGSQPIVSLNNVSLDVGEFLSKSINPILEDVNKYLEPVRPILDILNEEIPVISDLAQMLGQDKVTFIDAIKLFGSGGESIEKVFNILNAIDDFIEETANTQDNIKLNFGDFSFSQDLRNPGEIVIPDQPAESLDDVLGKIGNSTNNAAPIMALSDETPANSSSLNPIASLFKDLNDKTGIGFPILTDPSNIFKLLFGQAADLVVWDIPRLEAEFKYSQMFGPILPPIPLFARITGSLGVFADFFVGLDTRGLQGEDKNFFDGFYFGDRLEQKDGKVILLSDDIPEAGLNATFKAGAELNIAVASAGVEGGITAEINADWNDPDRNGKVYIDEIIKNAQQGLECIFDLEGALKAFLNAYVKIGFDTFFGFVTLFDESFNLATVTLLDFSHTCAPLPPPKLAHVEADGNLILHIGTNAGLRQPGYSTDGDETISVRQLSDGVMEVKGFGETQTYNNVTKIFGDAGIGDDVINIDASVTVNANLLGGDGNDQIRSGFGNDNIDGGEGDDQLLSGAGDDTISGQGGNDLIFGNAGADVISGGAGNDNLHGGNEDKAHQGDLSDTISGGEGSDNIWGDLGEDYLTGEAGNDNIRGGVGNDIIYGGLDADKVEGGGGSDLIYGNEGKDILLGEGQNVPLGQGGNDTIYAGADDDTIEDDEGDDILDGEGGFDSIKGGIGNDSIAGGDANDTLEGGKGNDTVFGGLNDDILHGQEGEDYLEGGDGNDQIFGGADNDQIIGGNSFISSNNGDDTIYGEDGNDRILGDNGNVQTLTLISSAGNDKIFGGSGNDLVYSQGGDDYVEGNIGLDTVFGGLGNDSLFGQEDVDYIEGGADRDRISGGAGDDLVIGGSSNLADLEDKSDGADEIIGDVGNDIILGDNGTINPVTRDVITNLNGGAGSDTIFGGVGNDIIFGGGLNDYLVGDAENGSGKDIVVGDQGSLNANFLVAEHSPVDNSAGNDTISGSGGEDILLGGDGNDSIAGDADADIIVGDNGKLTLNQGVVTRIETTNPENGGNDTITGSNGADILLGGTGDDNLSGGSDESADILLGDNGVVVINDASEDANDIFSIFPTAGGKDTIDGGAGNDIAIGGTAGDLLLGFTGADMLLGDHGRITRDNTDSVQRVATTFEDNGGDDTIDGNEGADIALGGQGNDNIKGGNADDILLGDNGVVVRNDGSEDANDIISTSPSSGGSDTITGDEGADIIVGGTVGDRISGNQDNDILLGDHGRITRNANDVVEKIETTFPDNGGDDTVEGNQGNDIILGGYANDKLSGNTEADIILGDNGVLNYVADKNPATLDLITTTDPNLGGNDTIDGNEGDDIAFGGTAADIINGGDGKDLVFGDRGKVDFSLPANQNFTSIDTSITDKGSNDIIHGNADDDIILGGQADDLIFGDGGDDDIIGGHNVAGGADGNDSIDGGTENDVIAGDNAIVTRRPDNLSTRMRVLAGETIYDDAGNPLITANSQPNPTVKTERNIQLLDHSVNADAKTFGNDAIAGGANNDMIFGQLGNDVIQGDSSISEVVSFTDPSVENSNDGDDYIEGNGGNDLMFGNSGQDDIIGDSSSLFGNDTSAKRPTGQDTIFGGAGTQIDRNNLGDQSTEGHARDADAIVGDNGNIFRLVGAKGNYSGKFLNFTYDSYNKSLQIIPRAIELLDYTPGGNPNNLGGDDLILGEAGDDVIYGMTGNDVLFGNGQDDDIFGGTGHDRIYGGTGEDGVLGDDGRILTSRNGETEILYGIKTPDQEGKIGLPGPFIGAIVNEKGRLKKEARWLAFNSGGNDVIYGGLGDDFLHGGAGDDGISGAEALPEFYNMLPVKNFNPLGYDPITRKLAAYDALNPRLKINNFFLNFEATNAKGEKVDDGKDYIFGDLGNDWLVGGTRNDRMFGGLGDDLLNADDNHDTNNGLNNRPDDPKFADGDFAFGGGGLDVMIANTGRDRLFDWTGEFNSFIVPFSPFGEPTVVRSISPHVVDFLLALGEGSGADQNLTEPNGELGLVTQKDPQWKDQHGAPRDPQPGNIPGVQRDTQGQPEWESSKGGGNSNQPPQAGGSNNQGNGNANLPPQVDNSNNQGNGNTNPEPEVDGNQPPKSKTIEVKTYTSNDSNLSIPDLGTLFSTLTIPDRASILDLNIQLGITHDRSNDLDVFLNSPDGKSVKLFANVGGNSNKLGNVTLDDDASLPISAISNPNATIFRPEGNLSTFNGLDLSGTWTLKIHDTNKQKAGTLKGWSMIVAKSN